MKINVDKELLIEHLKKVNFDYFYKVDEGEPHHDSIGYDHTIYYRSLRYVPNKVLKQWIKEIKDGIKKSKEKKYD